jgi:hypothetical protein
MSPEVSTTGVQVPTATTSSNRTAEERRHEEVLVSLRYLADQLDRIRAEMRCERCKAPAPPPPRWHGDVRTRDDRPAHTCGKTGGMR